MSNPIFNMFGNQNVQHSNNKNNNILFQLAQLKRNPAMILDILFQNGKINQKQYEELKPYSNNPEAIGKYLMNNGKWGEIEQAKNIANSTQ